MILNGTSANGTVANSEKVLELYLPISDAELLNELHAYPDGEERIEFAISAMKIGAIALRQAQGRIDADTVRQEGERFIQTMGHALEKHQTEITGQISSCLTEYFHPDSGRFNERVKRLVDGDDGEIARVILGQISGDGSELVQTLTTHVGTESPLMHMLDPNAKDGLINSLTESTKDTLTEQRELILREFTLDNGDGALSRTVSELTKKHGEVGEALENRIDEVVGEFSLDKEDSALSRLVGQVERAQRQISSEFSLDEEGSALARMQKRLLEVLAEQQTENRQFQENVNIALAEMNTRKEESMRGTQHGKDFEDEVVRFISERSQNAGDIATATGDSTGRIARSKKGDAVIELGPEHVAAGAKIVIEAKQDSSYTIAGALAELGEAKKNRDAGVGLFVFSSVSAPDGLEVFNRYDNDVVVVWDAEDPGSDVVFDAGLSVAKAISVAAAAHGAEVGSGIETIKKSILAIEKQANSLDGITKSANAIDNHVAKILDRARIVGNELNRQIGALNEEVNRLQ